jgi:pimeloyl-ACP methyl ester carboxylesterase
MENNNNNNGNNDNDNYKSHNGIQYKIYGNNKNSIKLCFISGLGGNKNHWYYQVQYFRKIDNFNICVFDNRNCGNSTINKESTIIDMADDTFMLLKYLNWTNVNIIGISMGGMIALEFCYKYNNIVNSLTLINTTLCGYRCLLNKELFKYTFKYLYHHISYLINKDPDIYLNHKINLISNFGFNKNYKVTKEYLNYKNNQSIDHLVYQMYAILKYKFNKKKIDKLRSYNIPIIAFTGKNDKIINYKNSLEIKNKLKCKLFLFKNTGHGLSIEDASLLNIILNKYFYYSFLIKYNQDLFNLLNYPKKIYNIIINF